VIVENVGGTAFVIPTLPTPTAPCCEAGK